MKILSDKTWWKMVDENFRLHAEIKTWREKAELLGLAGAPPSRRVVIERRPARDQAELANIFLFAEGDPVWDAVHEVLDEAIVEANNRVVEPQAEVRAIDRAAAEQGALMDFKARLMEAVASARAEDAARKQT